jgi:hypothetical protein
MNIHQVCVSYIHEQDRFLVRINTRQDEEVRLWFTRRLTLGLLPLLDKASGKLLASQAVPVSTAAPLQEQRQRMLDNFKQEAAAYDGDYQTPYRDTATVLPLGSEPLLVTEIKLTHLAHGQLQMEILEKLGESARNLQVCMDTQLICGLVQLLNQGVSASRWLEVGQKPLPMQTGASEASALGSEMEKPRYLN